MASTYSQWSVEKLKKELVKIEKAIKAKEATQKKLVVAELKAVARKHGYALSELVNDRRPKPSQAKLTKNGKSTLEAKRSQARSVPATKVKRRAKAKIKFRNPSNRSETWTGRGRQPRWIMAHLQQGGSLEELSI